MKIGLDYHGVIDKYPVIFSELSKKWQLSGHEVHIITGKEWEPVRISLSEINLVWDHAFSIVDYHLSLGTEMEKKDSGWWMDSNTWISSKGDYCKRESIELLFDNELRYADYLPNSCCFIHVKEHGFEKILSLF